MDQNGCDEFFRPMIRIENKEHPLQILPSVAITVARSERYAVATGATLSADQKCQEPQDRPPLTVPGLICGLSMILIMTGPE